MIHLVLELLPETYQKNDKDSTPPDDATGGSTPVSNR
jgi:hypothetical protein